MAIRPMVMPMPAGRAPRRQRLPSHRFQIETYPWEITPFLIAPVLPGETMASFTFQSRAYTSPVKHSACGWWLEYYWFYVSHRMIDDWAGTTDKQDMMLNPATTLPGRGSTSVEYYSAIDTVAFLEQAFKVVVEQYFRDEGEAWSTHAGKLYPMSKINMTTGLQSAMNESEWSSVDVNVDLDSDTNIMASEVELATQQWQMLRAGQLTDMDYEDYLRSQGIFVPPQIDDRPELLRYVRDWTYPVNTIDPSDGSPSAALSWAIKERADKARLFREPGFIVGVTVARPKVYRAKQRGNLAGCLDNALLWMPQQLQGRAEFSWKKYLGETSTAGASDGPLDGITDDYRIDMRDLFLYGDQFVNFALTETDNNLVALPPAGLGANLDYPTTTDTDGLFVGVTDAVRKVFHDGVCNFAIKGTVGPDMSP